MNLPFVIDVAIGLLFIYLILSLLASELQELITTLLQWRAKHLKDSIENLLAGGTSTQAEDQVKDLVDRLYNNPLIKTVNQEAKGVIARGFRVVTRWLFPGNRKGSFGRNQSTGPSYIPPETFATSLMDSLGISVLAEKLTEIRLQKFIHRIVGDFSSHGDGTVEIPADVDLEGNWEKGGVRVIAEKVGITNLNSDEKFRILVEDYDDIFRDYQSGEAALTTCVERMAYSLAGYIETCAALEPEDLHLDAKAKDYFIRRLKLFKLGLFGAKNERALLSGGLQPNAYEVAEMVNQASKTSKEIAAAYEALKTTTGAIAEKVDAEVLALLEERDRSSDPSTALQSLTNEQRRLYLNQAFNNLIEAGELREEDRKAYENYETYQEIKRLLSTVPKPVKDTLESLAGRAHAKLERGENYVNQFREELALWFDRSMSRASGVYKRNAKGVAIILGVLLAIITNADSFYMATRLASDENLRKVVTDRASQLSSGKDVTAITEAELEDLKNKADIVLQDLTLPVGWNPPNVIRQFRCNLETSPAPAVDGSLEVVRTRAEERNDLRRACLGPDAKTDVPVILQLMVAKPLEALRRLMGWLITGIAIAMGAPFWFDLLNRVVNVRNTGGKPPSPSS
ncbi:hypothetical protein J5X98_15550 [Leptothermofonsia sichuanensis E412]|uniref:hypothetical protein n=1 Tax=Leptothermofonsia sichuanensis TaxID=2917832 RepID=UPI001CA796FE|nr:hypothetical protein [Leptothermofonsia sichuanensis]QZZ18868.1 hypothetical protein J5X98_15550 [Leptothermofonsia sichuanensis E412]